MSGAALLLPVGRCVGSYAANDGSEFRVQQVLLGAEICELTDEQFATWSLAHGHPDHVVGRTWTRRDVLGALSGSAALRNPTATVDTLLARGLLAEVTPATEQAHAFATAHRLRPLLLGLGNSAEQPDVYTVGFHGRPIAAMTRGLYELWTRAHLAGDLWSACAQAVREAGPDATDADRSRQAAVDLRGERTRRRERTDALLAAVLPALHSLLAASAACLEPLDGAADRPAVTGRRR